jgi:ParB family chromosome partitioning protein
MSVVGEETAEITMLPIDRILQNPFQPRKEINENTLAELAESIRAHGIIQPLIVRKNEDGDYWIVAGERRWKAARTVGLLEVPVRVIEGTDIEMREVSLIENIQREDLSPIDTALALSELLSSFNLTQEEIASSIGWSRAAIANKIRLLNLPDEVKTYLNNNELTEGHCRLLLSLESNDIMIAFANDAVNNQLSVRQLEDLVKKAKTHKPNEHRNQHFYELPIQISDAAKALGISIKISGKPSKMKLHIEGVQSELLNEILYHIERTASKYFPGNNGDNNEASS